MRASRDHSFHDSYDEDFLASVGDCTFQFVQRTFVLFHVLLALSGVSVFCVGLFVFKADNNVLIGFLQDADAKGFFNAAIYLMIIGAISVFMPFIACIGTRKYNVQILSGYSVLFALVFLTKLAIVAVTFAYRTQLEENLTNVFDKTVEHYGESGKERQSSGMNALQSHIQCCGKLNFEDWIGTKWGRNHNNSVPMSCCSQPEEKHCNISDPFARENIFPEGCFSYVKKYYQENLHLISGFSAWSLVLESANMFFVFVFIFMMKRRQKKAQKDCGEIVESYAMKDF